MHECNNITDFYHQHFRDHFRISRITIDRSLFVTESYCEMWMFGEIMKLMKMKENKITMKNEKYKIENYQYL